MIARQALAAAAVYAVLALAFLAQGLLPGRTLASADYLYSAAPWTAVAPPGVPGLGANPELVDPATVFEPFTQYIAAQVPHAPLWNPYIMGGRPLEGDGQSGLFSPYSVPSYVLPFWSSLEIAALLKLFVAALGAFLLGRVAFGLRFAGALLAGVVFAFGLTFVAWLPWPLTSVWSFTPWLLLAADRLVRRPAPLNVAALAALVALQYAGGHPESSFHVMALTAIFAAYRLVQRARARGARDVWPALGAVASAIVLGTALAAVVIGPLVELLVHSSDVSERAGHIPVTPAKFLLGIVLPDYWGRPTQTTLAGFEVQRAFYAGVLPLLLAAVALLRRRNADRAFLFVVGFVCLAVVVGARPFSSVFNHLPGFDVTYNTRLTIFYVLALALLAGLGLDELMLRAPAVRLRGGRGLLVLGGAVLLAPVALLAVRGQLSAGLLGHALDVAWGFAREPFGFSPDVAKVIRMASVILWLSFAGASLALLALRRRGRLAPATFAVLALALVAGDLFRAGVGENPAIPIAHAQQPATGAIGYLQSKRPARFVGVSPSRPFESIPLTPDTAMRYGLYDARGYDLPVVSRYNALWRHSVSNATLIIPPTQLAPVDAASLPALDLLGVADVLQAPLDAPLHGFGLTLVYSGSDARVYRNPAAMPRATLVSDVRLVAGDGAALRAVTTPGFAAARVAVAERPIAGLGGGGAGPAGQARIVDYGAERVVMSADARRRSLLVLDDVFYPGWRATVDGRRVPIVRVDYLLRGVVVGPGAHVVVMSYDPASWRIGELVSLLALLVLVALVGWGLLRRRSGASRPRPSPLPASG